MLHGSQPDAFMVCHEPSRKNMRGVQTPLPTIQQVIDATITMGSLTNPDIQCVGICVNTTAMSEDEAKDYLAKLGEQYSLPAVDPLRFGSEPIVAVLQERF